MTNTYYKKVNYNFNWKVDKIIRFFYFLKKINFKSINMRYFVQLSIYHKEINVHPAVHAYKSPVSYNVSFLSKEWAD